VELQAARTATANPAEGHGTTGAPLARVAPRHHGRAIHESRREPIPNDDCRKRTQNAPNPYFRNCAHRSLPSARAWIVSKLRISTFHRIGQDFGGEGGPTGGLTVPGSEPTLGTILETRKLLKIVGQYSRTTLFTILNPIRIPKRLNVLSAVRSSEGK
jgi:hypothetical protein